MEGYIVLCDHNTKWCEVFVEEMSKRKVQTVTIENISDEEDMLLNGEFSGILVCSLTELQEYISMRGDNERRQKNLFKAVSVFIISDSNDDKTEIDLIRKGCVDLQWRKRNVLIIVERVIASLKKNEIKNRLKIDTENYYMIYANEKLELKKREADFLKILLEADDIVSTDNICMLLWGKSDKKTKTNLYNLIFELRQKMPDKGEIIQNSYGKGFFVSKNDVQIVS